MTSKLIARILTKSGEIAAEVFEVTIGGRVHWRWTGKWGAGCGSPASVRESVQVSMRSKRGWVAEIALPADGAA